MTLTRYVTGLAALGLTGMVLTGTSCSDLVDTLKSAQSSYGELRTSIEEGLTYASTVAVETARAQMEEDGLGPRPAAVTAALEAEYKGNGVEAEFYHFCEVKLARPETSKQLMDITIKRDEIFKKFPDYQHKESWYCKKDPETGGPKIEFSRNVAAKSPYAGNSDYKTILSVREAAGINRSAVGDKFELSMTSKEMGFLKRCNADYNQEVKIAKGKLDKKNAIKISYNDLTEGRDGLLTAHSQPAESWLCDSTPKKDADGEYLTSAAEISFQVEYVPSETAEEGTSLEDALKDSEDPLNKKIHLTRTEAGVARQGKFSKDMLVLERQASQNCETVYNTQWLPQKKAVNAPMRSTLEDMFKEIYDLAKQGKLKEANERAKERKQKEVYLFTEYSAFELGDLPTGIDYKVGPEITEKRDELLLKNGRNKESWVCNISTGDLIIQGHKPNPTYNEFVGESWTLFPDTIPGSVKAKDHRKIVKKENAALLNSLGITNQVAEYEKICTKTPITDTLDSARLAELNQEVYTILAGQGNLSNKKLVQQPDGNYRLFNEPSVFTQKASCDALGDKSFFILDVPGRKADPVIYLGSYGASKNSGRGSNDIAAKSLAGCFTTPNLLSCVDSTEMNKIRVNNGGYTRTKRVRGETTRVFLHNIEDLVNNPSEGKIPRFRRPSYSEYKFLTGEWSPSLCGPQDTIQTCEQKQVKLNSEDWAPLICAPEDTYESCDQKQQDHSELTAEARAELITQRESEQAALEAAEAAHSHQVLKPKKKGLFAKLFGKDERTEPGRWF